MKEKILSHYASGKGEITIFVDGDAETLDKKFRVYARAIVNEKDYETTRTFTRDDTPDAHLDDARAMLGKIANKSGFVPESDEAFDTAAELIVANVTRYIVEMGAQTQPAPVDDGAQRFDVAFIVGEHTINPAEVLSVLTRYVNEKHPRSHNLVRVTQVRE